MTDTAPQTALSAAVDAALSSDLPELLALLEHRDGVFHVEDERALVVARTMIHPSAAQLGGWLPSNDGQRLLLVRHRGVVADLIDAIYTGEDGKFLHQVRSRSGAGNFRLIYALPEQAGDAEMAVGAMRQAASKVLLGRAMAKPAAPAAALDSLPMPTPDAPPKD